MPPVRCGYRDRLSARPWITNTVGTAYGFVTGLFIDDVNMNVQVSDGNGNPASPIDSTTGQPMTPDTWRKHMATFVEELRAAATGLGRSPTMSSGMPDPHCSDQDPSIQREIAAADVICLERGVASDAGLSGGTRDDSVYSFLTLSTGFTPAANPSSFLNTLSMPPVSNTDWRATS